MSSKPTIQRENLKGMTANAVWNPNYVRGCTEKAVQLLIGAGAKGPALELISGAARHLECCETHDCRAYRAELSGAVAKVRRERRKQRKDIRPWEHWIFQAAEAVLHPTPGCKHRAITFLRSAITEYDEALGHYPSQLAQTWITWLEEHEQNVPPYTSEPKRRGHA